MVALTRGIPPALLTALAGTLNPVVFVYLDWPGETVRAHSAVGTITWGGHDWTGVGNFGAITLPGEFAGMVNAQAELSLVGDPATLDGYCGAAIRNRDGAIYFGGLTGRPGESSTLVSDPVEVFAGQMDVYSVDASMTETGVEHAAIVRLITGPGARSDAAVVHSDQDQSGKFPGDTAGALLVLAIANAQAFQW